MTDMRGGHKVRDHLSVDEEDALARAPLRTSRSASTFYRNVLVALIVVVLCGYGLFHYIHQSKTADATPATPAMPPAAVAEAPVLAPPPLPQVSTPPQSLAECMGPDNLIDEAVADCRFGKSHKTVPRSTAQGMVSAQYMSQYKARQPIRHRNYAMAQFVDSAVVWQWDRKRTYRAEWVVDDDQIDGTSVCRNWRRGSIEYRECRKGAKVYFKEQCKRSAESATRQRYCSAASGFNPLG